MPQTPAEAARVSKFNATLEWKAAIDELVKDTTDLSIIDSEIERIIDKVELKARKLQEACVDYAIKLTEDPLLDPHAAEINALHARTGSVVTQAKIRLDANAPQAISDSARIAMIYEDIDGVLDMIMQTYKSVEDLIDDQGDLPQDYRGYAESRIKQMEDHFLKSAKPLYNDLRTKFDAGTAQAATTKYNAEKTKVTKFIN